MPVRLQVPNRVVYSPHEYGPGVFPQPWFADPNMRRILFDRWEKGFSYIAETGVAPILVGEFGGKDSSLATLEGQSQNQFVDFLRDKGYSWTYWAWNPNSGETGGILKDDWVTVNQPKQDMLNRLIGAVPSLLPRRTGGSRST